MVKDAIEMIQQRLENSRSKSTVVVEPMLITRQILPKRNRSSI
jgi:hypothetical protein